METAGFTSSLYTQSNNPWGMRPPTKRVTSAAGVIDTANGPFAVYGSIPDATQDIVLWMDARLFPAKVSSLTEFVKELGARGYYGKEPAKEYQKKIEAWMAR